MELTLIIVTAALSLMGGFAFYKAGRMKAYATKEALLAAGFGWMEKLPQSVGRLIGFLELAGAIGVVAGPIGYFLGLDWALWFAIAAAIGLALTIFGAILVHAARGETKYTFKMTFPLLALSILIAAGWISYLSL